MIKIKSTECLNNLEKGPIYRSLFDNGACYLFHEAKGFAGAKVSLTFLAGSMFENVEEHGLAHLIEHLIFKEVDTTYIKELETEGAVINAYTYKENVTFEMSCLARKLPPLLDTFFKLFLSLEFTQEQFEKEKKVVMQELNEDQDDHESYGLEYIFKKNFGLGLSHPVGGTIAQVKKYTAKDVYRYYKKHFRPERMILSVVSGVDHQQVISETIARCMEMSHKKPFRLKSLKKQGRLEHFKSTQKRKLESPIIYYSFDGPTLTSEYYYDYFIMDEILFEGLSSKFFIKFREERPLVYGLGSSINTFGKVGNYIMVFNSSLKQINEVKKGVKDVLSDVAQNGLDENRIEKIKARIVEDWELAFDDLDERLDFLMENEIYQLQNFSIEEIKNRINKVSNKRIQRMAQNMLTPGQHSTLVLTKKEANT